MCFVGVWPPRALCTLLQYVLACLLVWFMPTYFACTFVPSRPLHHIAKIVYHEVGLMQAHTIEQSAVEIDALKFCLSHQEP